MGKWSQREKTYLWLPLRENSNQPAHPRSLIRVFISQMKKLCILGYPKCAQWRFWSDFSNAQVDLHLRLAPMSKRFLNYFPENAITFILTMYNINNEIRPRGYKTFFMLNSAEHELFSANKYENANNSWHFHIYLQRNFYAQLCLARKNLQMSISMKNFMLSWVEHGTRLGSGL